MARITVTTEDGEAVLTLYDYQLPCMYLDGPLSLMSHTRDLEEAVAGARDLEAQGKPCSSTSGPYRCSKRGLHGSHVARTSFGELVWN